MKSKRVKNYWIKKKESCNNKGDASARAKQLRINEYITHVIVEKSEDAYLVRYSVARWYYEQIQELGIQL